MRGLAQLASARYFVPIAVALLFSGLGDAITGPFFALFLSDKAGLTPFPLGVLLTARAVFGIAIATLFGRWFDRAPSVAPLFIALGMAALGCVLLSITTDYVALLAIICIALGAGASCFPQLFALAKGHLDRHDARLAERGVSLLRALWSVAWTAGPALGALVIVRFDFAGVFLTTALCATAALAVLVAGAVRAPPRVAGATIERVPWTTALRVAAPAATALTLFNMAMIMGSIALSISVVHDMGGTRRDVGHAFSLCALLEVLVMSGFVIRPVNAESRAWLSAGFVAFVLYFALIAALPTVATVLAAQALRAVAIGIVGCLGIGYCQAILRGRVGAATALFANSVNAGSLLSGLGTGAWGEAFGYRSMFGACAALSGLGLLILQFQPRSPTPGPSHGT